MDLQRYGSNIGLTSIPSGISDNHSWGSSPDLVQSGTMRVFGTLVHVIRPSAKSFAFPSSIVQPSVKLDYRVACGNVPEAIAACQIFGKWFRSYYLHCFRLRAQERKTKFWLFDERRFCSRSSRFMKTTWRNQQIWHHITMSKPPSGLQRKPSISLLVWPLDWSNAFMLNIVWYR